MKQYIFLLLTLSTLLGCKNDTQEEDNYVYFGGEIINPTNDYVLLYNSEDDVDTLYMDENNRFLKKISNFKSGLYTFFHGGEYQWLLLEPKDSLLIRLNTIDFDESLVFTGDGARKNNYLIKTFLENEDDNQKFMHLCQMEPAAFEKVLDSIKDKKLNDLNDFIKQNSYSKLFQEIATTSINYNYYANKEIYPFGYFGYSNLIHFKDLPPNFYDYRKEIDYNNEALSDFYTYNKFLYSHFNNLALAKYYKNATHNVVFDNKSVNYNLEKLNLMDSLVSNRRIKNSLLKNTTRDFILVSQDSSEIQEVLGSFLKRTTSDKDKKYINELVHSIKNLKRGKRLPSLELLDYNDNIVLIDTLVKRATVIYFWSSNLPVHMRNSHYKVNALKTKYPQFDFIGININDDDNSHWKSTLTLNKLPVTNEYQFKEPNDAMNALAINSVNKSILVNKDSKIINPNALLFSSEFEEQLERLSHKKQ
ncbi:MAG: hypothetical protein KDD03_01960 [Gelidibacter sp.]|nr:hypothetical protein [Gelidibacter sp.]